MKFTMVDYRNLATVKQAAMEAPFITEAKLRWWIFRAETNGLKPALITIGGRVYIGPRRIQQVAGGSAYDQKALNNAA